MLLAATDAAVAAPLSASSGVASDPLTTSVEAVLPASITARGSSATAYVTNSEDDTVTPIDVDTNTPGAPIPVGDYPWGVAVTPDGATAYVANSGDDTVTPIDVATNTAGAPIPVNDDPGLVSPHGVAVTADGTTVYVTHGGGVTPIDVATNTAGALISWPFTRPNDGVAVTPDGAVAYVADGDGYIGATRIDLVTRTAGATFLVGSDPHGVAVTPDGSTAYVATRNGLVPIDVATNTAGSPIPSSGSWSYGVAVTPDGTTAYVTGHFIEPYLVPVDVATNTASNSISMGPAYSGVLTAVAIAPDGATAYVTNGNRGTVTPVDLATNTAGAPIQVGGWPRGVAVAAGGGGGNDVYKYVALGDSFSAGEGIEDFFEPGNRCHRSELAYPTFVEQPGLTGLSVFTRRQAGDTSVKWGFQACSGATTAEVVYDDAQLHGDFLGQLALNRTGDTGNDNDLPVDAATDLVTITIGGNDLKFSKIVAFCLRKLNCRTAIFRDGKPLNRWLRDERNTLSHQLDIVFSRIYRQAPDARILVLGYPQRFPASLPEQLCLRLSTPIYNVPLFSWTPYEQNYLRQATSEANQLIAARVEAALIPAGQITFVPVDTLFAGHEICGRRRDWINAATPTLSRAGVSLNPQSFHPNEYGQRSGYAAAINTVLGN